MKFAVFISGWQVTGNLVYFILICILYFFFFYNEQVKYKKECSETSRKWKNPFVMQIIASSIS